MFAYCNNNPVNHKDETGKIPWTIIDGVVQLVKDIYQLIRDDDKKVTITKDEYDGKTNITINNSASITTPTVKFVYSFYLNNFSEYSDDIKGSTAGMVFEWEVHNVTYYVLQVAKDFGIDKPELIESAESVDLGPTIYNDNHGGSGDIMKALYSASNPITALFDLLAYTNDCIRRSR